VNAASVDRLLKRARSTVLVTVPGRSFHDAETGRALSVPPTEYRPNGVIVPDEAPNDETAPAGALQRRVRAYLAAILPSGASWPVPKAGHTLADGIASYSIDAVTVYRLRDIAILYEVRAFA
jgi:hypothetical protein